VRDAGWGALVARGAAAMPNVARVARDRLNEDIKRAARDGHLGNVAPELAFDFVIGIVMRAMQSASEKRLSPKQAPEVVAGILRAIGVAPAKASAVAQRVMRRN
jgi:hypothetical protein